MNRPLYDANVAFDQRPQPVGVNVWLTVAVGAGRDLIEVTAHSLREFQERDFRTQFGAVGMRYISPLYDEEFFIRELAQMRLTGDTRFLEPRHDHRGLAATAAFCAVAETEPTFFAAQLCAIMQSLGLSRADGMELDDGTAASAQRPTSSRQLTTSKPANRTRQRAGGRKRTATGTTKPALKMTSATESIAPVARETAPGSPFYSSIAPATTVLSATSAGAASVAAPASVAPIQSGTSGERATIKASQKSLAIASAQAGDPV